MNPVDTCQSTEHFYADLAAFNDFADLARAASYTPLPEDWHVAVTDVENSTQKIRSGRYREVNAVGAASIIAVLNAVRPIPVPYVFGGDGAGLCVPSSQLEAVKEALLATKRLARRQFQLSLRAAVVPVKNIMNSPHRLLVGKYQVSPHYQQAMFSGGGISYAEQLMKQDTQNTYCLAGDGRGMEADYSGFECRWKNIENPRGEILALLVKARNAADDNARVYAPLIAKIQEIFEDERRYCPVRQDTLSLAANTRDLSGEIGVRTGLKNQFSKMVYSCMLPWQVRLGKVLMKYNIKAFKTRWGDYKKTLVLNSDYRKFDDMLRMVINSTKKQRRMLEEYLEEQRRRKRIAYGIHASEAALITCMVFDYDTDHVHFVDGSRGGYAMAAKMLKEQIKKDNE